MTVLFWHSFGSSSFTTHAQVQSFEGPLEFYYPGQPDMTLVAGSVNVMGALMQKCQES